MKNKLSGLAALFEESGKCMMSLPGLMIAPLIAFLVLALFLAFWVLVVICIATASAPGDKNPFAPLDNTAAHATTNDVTFTQTGTKSKYFYKKKNVLRILPRRPTMYLQIIIPFSFVLLE